MTEQRLSEITDVINHLNRVAAANFSPGFDDTKKAIDNLLNLGFTVDDLKDVVDRKWNDWKGTEFENYVRPATLFGKKFETYLNESRTPKQTRITKLFNAVQNAKQANWRLDKK